MIMTAKKDLIAALVVTGFLTASVAGYSIWTSGETAETLRTSVNTETAAAAAETYDTADVYVSSVVTETQTTENGLFTERDLTQTADLSEAVYYTLSDGDIVKIEQEGVYVFSGNASEAQILVDAADENKIQIVLDDLTVTNTSVPCIYVKNADKVFVTVTETDCALSVTGPFSADGDTDTDAVIYSKDDLVLNGEGTVTIVSSANGVTCKDDLKITGGAWNISCSADALEAEESIAVADGVIVIRTQKDGIHAENSDDNTTGSVTVCGGEITVTASDDGIHATTVFTLEGGTLNITAAEGVEATRVVILNGEVNISASDDGINAGQKSKTMQAGIEISGGTVTVRMSAGDTDAIDSNGYLTVSGGTLDLTAQSPFDADGTVSYTGGTIIVNGQVTDTISIQMMGGMGGMMGGRK